MAENIAYGRPDATMEQIRVAAIAAKADEFIQEMPVGCDRLRTVPGTGGQKQGWQLLAIIYDAPILILDEATSGGY